MKRKKVNEWYRERLEKVEGLLLNICQKEVTPNYAYYPVMINENKFGIGRDELRERLLHSQLVKGY